VKDYVAGWVAFACKGIVTADGYSMIPFGEFRWPNVSYGAALASLLRKGPLGIGLSEYLEGDGELAFRHACKMGLEGIVSKRRNSPYKPVRR
jgi:hypothetical protein